MKRALRILLIGITALLVAGVLLIAVVLWTQPGLNWALAVGKGFIPGELRVAAARGSLARELRIEGLHYRHNGLDVRLRSATLIWAPQHLLQGTLVVEGLDAAGLRVALPQTPAGPDTRTEAAGPPAVAIPLRVELKRIAVEEMTFLPAGGEPVDIQSLRTSLRAAGSEIELAVFELASAVARLQAEGRIGLARDSPTRVDVQWRTGQALPRTYAGSGTLTGTFARYRLEHQLSEPIRAELTGELQRPFETLDWALKLDLPATPLARLDPALPATQLALRLTASGDLQQAEFQSRITTDWLDLRGQPVEAGGRLALTSSGELQLTQASVVTGESRVQGQGQWHPGDGRGELHLSWPRLQWPLQGEARWSVRDGEADWRGRLDDYQLAFQSMLAGAAVPEAALRLEARGSLSGMTFDTLTAETLEGRINAAGNLDWRDRASWSLTASVADIEPQARWPEWPGRLSFELASDGEVVPAGLAARVRLTGLTGELRDRPVRGKGMVIVTGDQWRLEEVALRSGDNRLEAAGGLHLDGGLAWQARLPDLSALLPAATGGLQTQGRLTGQWPATRAEADFASDGLSLADVSLGGIEGRLEAALDDADAPLALRLEGVDWHWRARTLDRLAVSVTGSLAEHDLSVQGRGPTHAIVLTAQGEWREQQWSARLTELDWQLPEAGEWRLADPVRVTIGAERIELPSTCWEQDAARACLQGEAAGTLARWQGRMNLSDLPVARLPLDWPAGVALSSELDADMNLERNAAGMRGSGSLELAPGEIVWDSGQTQERRVQHGSGELAWSLDDSGAEATVTLTLIGTDRLSGRVSLPGFDPLAGAATGQSLEGQAEASVTELSVIELFVPQVTDLEGRVELDASLAGTVGAPRLRARAALRDAAATLPAAGIRVTGVRVEARSDPDGRIALDGQARSGEGRVRLGGSIDFQPQGWRGEFTLAGQDFLMLDIPEARLPVSPDLKVDVSPPEIALTGDIHIDEASLAPRDFSNAVAPSRDTVIVSEKSEPTRAWRVSSDVHLHLGEAIEFEGYGLTGRITGDLQIIDAPGQITRARGDLRILDGIYKVYGQELNIESGRLIYSGGPIDNPGVDATAIRKTGQVTAGVRLSGFLQQPEAELFSTPEMSQANTLSYLMFGRPVKSASSDQGQLMAKATTALGVKGGNLLATQIGNMLGLDEVEVTGGETLEESALMIGKYLSPRLYVNYSVGLFETVSTLKLRYELSRRWTLETQLGAETGGDLIWSIER